MNPAAAQPDGDLPAALTQLDRAINALTTPLGQYLEGEYFETPSPYDQLLDAVPGQQGGGGHTSRSLPPVWVDAVKLLGEIDTRIKRWQPSATSFIGPLPQHWCRLVADENPTITRLNHLRERHWRPQDIHILTGYAQQITTWVLDIETMLTPTRKWSLPNPCPACNQAVVHRRDNAGQDVRQPALRITEDGCECLNCHEKWTPEYFQHLANVLTTSRSSMDRNQLAALLRETFWQSITDDHNPFGWYTPEGERIEGKLPSTLFDRMADAVNDGLRTANTTR